MFKLTVIHGPGKGQVFKIDSGEKSIGRAPDNDFVIQSNQISKKHCMVSVNGPAILVRDTGSSNGTFVNGMLVKQKTLMSGDRISVGDCVIEVTKITVSMPASNVVPLKGTNGMGISLGTGAVQMPAAAIAEEPKDLKGKVKFLFEKFVLNFLYNLNEKQEWKTLASYIFIFMAIASAVAGVYPVLERVNAKLESEATERAFIIARQMVDRNSVHIFEKMESKVDVSFAEKEKGVLAAYVLDTEGRVLAPARKANQYLTEASEAAFSAISRDRFDKKEKLEEFWKVYGSAVMVAVPLRVFNAAQGKNVTAAFGIVSYDRGQVIFDGGTTALAYIQSLILVGIFAVIAYFSMYRLTLKPLETLNEDIDLALKNGGSSLPRKYKMAEIDPLVDIVSSTLQRAASGGGTGGIGGSHGDSDDTLNVLKFMADQLKGSGAIIFTPERQVSHMNHFMEELLGIRMAMAAGAEFSTVSRDDAFSAFVQDSVSRATPGAPPIQDTFEFSGTNFRMDCIAVGVPGAPKYFVMTAHKED